MGWSWRVDLKKGLAMGHAIRPRMLSVDPAVMDRHARAVVGTLGQSALRLAPDEELEGRGRQLDRGERARSSGGAARRSKPATAAAPLSSQALAYAAVGFSGGGPSAPAKARAILLVVREGVSYRAAARETGVSPSRVFGLVRRFRETLARHALAASTMRRRDP